MKPHPIKCRLTPCIEILEGRIAPAVSVFPLSSLDGNNGFVLSGAASRDYSGWSVSDAGDVNGDGFGDVLIGATGVGGHAGASYVVFGKANGFAASLNLSTLNGSNGFKLSGVAAGDYSGFTVSAAGDVNGDGFGDLIIGAHRAAPGGTDSGASYVVFGKASGFAASLNLSTLNGSNGFKVSGTASGDHAGISVHTAGDVNGDGFDDLIIGAYEADPNGNYSGASYVVFGKANGFTANLPLSTLNGSNGFKLSGVAANDNSGRAVSAAGDVNHDGFDDLIIGAPKVVINGLQTGAAYVVFGKATGFTANLNLSTLNGSNGFKLSGAASLDFTGSAVSAAGDVNGDGFADVLVGAFGVDTPSDGSYSGASYIVFGKAGGFAANLDLATLNGSNGFKLTGRGSTKSGFAVSNAGDFNGDGFDDLIIGSGSNYGSTIGESYVVFGKVSGFAANLNLTALNGSNGFMLTGAALDDHSGRSISTAGDVNGDGFDDLIIGAFSADPVGYDSGASYVVFGSALGPLPSLAVNDVNVIEPANGTINASFTVTLSASSAQPVTVQYATADGTATAPTDYLGKTISTLTFAPGETSKTVLITINANSPSEVDETFFINLTNPTNATVSDGQGVATIIDKSLLQLSSLNGSNGFKVIGQTVGDRAGGAVSDAGDVNGDGFDDLIIGAPRADPHGADSGASYVVFGKAGGFPTSLNVSSLNGTNGFKLSGAVAADAAGISVSGAGDVNGDGFSDLLVGASGADPNNYAAGASYVVFGKANGFAANLDLSTLNGSNGFKLSGDGLSNRAGGSVSSAGDINGDGFDDLIIGASGASPNGSQSGASYVVFGKANGFAANLNLSTLNGGNGFTLNGALGGDSSGQSVSAAGDVNGDGFDDILVGAFLADAPASDSGATYVVFGKASGWTATLNLSTLNGSNGFKLGGANGAEFSGYSVSGAGDLNGDGFADIVIGAPRSSPNGNASGASYVVFGKAGGFVADLNLSTLNGSNGFKLSGAAFNDRAGQSVSGAGDFNGDGFDDLIVSAYWAPNGTKIGASYLVFGKAGGFSANLNLATLNGANGIKISGTATYEYSGISVSRAGDVNGDGFDDVVIGAADINATKAGTTYVVFGHGVGFSISDASVNEGNAGSTALQFTVSLSEPGDSAVSVKVATSNGSAQAGSDFTGNALTTITFAPGETSKTVSVDVTGDTLFENDETFSIVMSSAVGGLIKHGTGVGTIRNDDSPPVISISGGSFLEGDTGTSDATFTVSLSAPSGLPVSVHVASADGTALAGSDYAALAQDLAFAPGETSKTITVKLVGDTSIEDHETFSVALSAVSGATIGSGLAAGTILNDDTALHISDVGNVLEGNSGTTGVVFSVTLEKASALPVTVNYASAAGTATGGSDYTSVGGSLTFAPGEISKTITVNVLGDTSIEDHESFTVGLATATNATIAQNTASATILNDDTALRITDAGSVLEGDSGTMGLVFSVNLEKASALPVTVNYASADGTATSGSDYTSAAGLLTFAPGETSKTITINVLGDTSIEDHESFTVGLATSTNATIAQNTASGTILNDDTALSISDAGSVLEGNSGTTGLVFSVTLEKASALPVTVNYASADGTATGGNDYTSAIGSLTFAPGETSKTITINVLGDTSIEDHESFTVGLTSPLHATLARTTATATILNDDTALHIASVAAREGDSGSTPFVFSITLEKPSALPVTVSYSTADGTAIAGSDYLAALTTPLVFAPGETVKTVAFAVAGDTEVEAHETFSVILSAASGAVLAESVAPGTILNDDTLVRITDAALLEGHTGTQTMVFTVSLAARTTLPVSVNFTSIAGTATPGVDYTALLPGKLDFAPGETSKTLSVEIKGDTIAEASETFSIVLADSTNAVIDDGIGLGTILNDDVTLLSRHRATYTDVDGETVTIRVSHGILKVEDFTLFPSGLGSQLAFVDFSGQAEFSGINLSISAQAPQGSAQGDHLVNVGYINATGIDLGRVVIKGDLGQIDAGNALTAKPGLRTLKAESMGAFGLQTQLPGGSLQSDIVGKLGSLDLRQNLQDATLSVSGDIGSLWVHGDLRDSAILSDGRIGVIRITGDLAGSEDSAAIISARGHLDPASPSESLAIHRLVVQGSVDHAQILAGYDRSGVGTNSQVRVGLVFAGSDWSASSLAAGVLAGNDQEFGTADDKLIPPSGSILAKIARIVIRGSASGSSLVGDHFGFVAEEIAVLRVSGASLTLAPGAGNDLTGQLVGTSGDLRVREVA